MAKSKQPFAKMGDTIDGDAVEKPAGQTPPSHAGASKDSKTESYPRGPSSNVGSLIALAALALSVFAVGLASFAIWEQRQNTAGVATLMPVSNSDAGELADIANSDLVDRLDALERRLDADRQRQQSTLAALQDQMASPSSPPPENSQNNDLGSGANADIAAIRNDMDQRFAALKAILANQALPVKAGGGADDNAHSLPAADAQPANTSKQMTAPTGLLIVSGLLADNLAGQPLDRWLSLLQGLANHGANITGLAPLQSAANPMPDSPHQLLQKAYDLVPQMTAALNRAADDAGFLEKTGAKLSQLVQLREIGNEAGGNAAALDDFETALALQNLGGAINAAGQWSGSDLPSLDAWLAAAKAMGLGYPGGAAIEVAAKSGDAKAITLPRPLKGSAGCHFSFSGLKTAFVNRLSQLGGPELAPIADLAASLQTAIADCLADRTKAALSRFREEFPQDDTNQPVLVIAGGVAANQHIFGVLQRVATDNNFRLSVPPAKLCTDNAAMIAWAALERVDRPDDLAFAPRPRWPLDPKASPPPGRGVRQ